VGCACEGRRAGGLPRFGEPLDHNGCGGDYEEMVAIFDRDSHLRRWLLWRTLDGIIVQPLIGRNIRCFDAAEAIEILSRRRSGEHNQIRSGDQG
jgi:hypothetical protein